MDWRAPYDGVQQPFDEEPPLAVFPALYQSSKRREKPHLIRASSAVSGVRLQIPKTYCLARDGVGTSHA